MTFNLAELEARRAAKQNTSVYCAGAEGRTTGGQDPRNHWHPDSVFGAGAIHEIRWATGTAD